MVLLVLRKAEELCIGRTWTVATTKTLREQPSEAAAELSIAAA